MSALRIAISSIVGCSIVMSQVAFAAAPNYADIKTVVVIYAENRSFDSLFGQFPGGEWPGARYTPGQYTQLDRDNSTLPYLPAVAGGVGSGVTAGAPGSPTSSNPVIYPSQVQTGSYFSINNINHPYKHPVALTI